MCTARRPLSIPVRLARCLAPLLALLVIGTLLPGTPAATALAAQPTFAAPQQLPAASVALAAAPVVSPSFTSSWLSSESDATTSVAWGDYDGDGDLDLAVGNNGPNRLYRNDAGVLTASAVWSSSESDDTRSVAWGDYDGDGDLDLVAGNLGQPTRLYRNDAGVLTSSAIWSSAESDGTTSVAWGDYDGDGDLDLAVGNIGQNRLYRNDAGVLTSSAIWSSTENDNTRSVVWGDYDGDGDLDLAAGNDRQNRLYRNDTGVLTSSAIWSSAESDATTSVAWGDYDGDGDLDLAAGNYGQPTRLYRNDTGVLTSSAIWSSAESDNTRSVAWGDYDGDGDLDLAVGNAGQNRLYRNDAGVLASSAVWSSAGSDTTESVAWGDVDGDGDLDLAVGNDGQPNRLYRNDAGVLTSSAVWASAESDATTSVAWGDYDGDGDLDLAAGNTGQPNRLYRNDAGVLTSSAIWSSAGSDRTLSVAWGDYDGDGDLDLAAGNDGQNRLYRNDAGVLTSSAIWSSAENDGTWSVAWGDYDGDGDLDLAAGNDGQPNRLYRNDAGVLTSSAVWASAESDATTSVAWGDYDGDGDLDLAAGNTGQPNRLYRNDAGVLTSSAVWSSSESDRTVSVAWGDYDGDGDLDLVAGNLGQPNRLYRNDAGVLTSSAAWSSAESDGTVSVAWGDYDGDGDLDLAVGNVGQPTRLYHNTRHDHGSSDTTPVIRMQSPNTTPPLRGAYFYARPQILDQQLITLPYTMVHPDSLTVARLIGQYSLDGGGHWRLAAPVDTQTTNLSSSPGGVAHTYTWDTFADGDPDKGVFGQSDNVVFRIIAVPSLNARANQIPGPYLYGAAASSTLPFRVRGTQPRVLRDGAPLAGALVYRLRPPSPDPTADPRAQLMRDGLGRILRTNQLGYLAGRSPIALNDSLIALQPIGATNTYSLYFTSAAPNATGLAVTPISNPGVQTLTVASTNPLMLLNLSVALEWDARKDIAFLNRLQSDLQRVSALLYDFTDGQVALGDVRIYQNRAHWYDTLDAHGALVTKAADIRIHLSNHLRPNANQGGITTQDRVDPNNAKISYEFGHVRIGAVWNSDGDVVQKEGDDWARALAHELGHYALFLDDNYLGLDSSGRFTAIAGCRGAMSDPYRDDWTEFQPAGAEWDAKCQGTLSERLTGRSDWQTIKTFYDNLAPGFVLNAPASFGANPGPSTLPLAVTQFTVVAPAGTAPLDSRLVALTKPDATPYAPSDSARAFLFSADGTQLADLGQPAGSASQSQVTLRAAHTGDQLCVFDQAQASLGCAGLTANIQPLTVAPRSDWQPDVIVTPVTSRTLTLEVPADGVGTPAPAQLRARLFAADSNQAPASVDLQLVGDTYRGTLTLTEPVLEGSVYVEAPNDASSPPRAIVSDYALGGNPAPPRRPRAKTRRRAPVTSPDGQVILYSDDLIFAPNEFFFFALQTATRLPAPPEGQTIIGQGYRLLASDSSRLAKMAINMAYAESAAAGKDVAVYYYGQDAQGDLRWQRLPAPLVNTQNEVTAQVRGAGLYVLLARPWQSRLGLVRR